ncbi:hypothetical protein AVEN_258550-1, partial [Araneus ventricosus]
MPSIYSSFHNRLTSPLLKFRRYAINTNLESGRTLTMNGNRQLVGESRSSTTTENQLTCRLIMMALSEMQLQLE